MAGILPLIARSGFPSPLPNICYSDLQFTGRPPQCFPSSSKPLGEGLVVGSDEYLDLVADGRKVEGHVGNGDGGNGEGGEGLSSLFSVDHACHRHGIHAHNL